VCGELTFKSRRQNFTPLVKKCYQLYFGCKVGDLDKSWAPHICCVPGVTLLTGWVNCSRQMPFAVLKVWKEPKDLSSVCYSCLANIRDHIQIQTNNELSRFAICNEACPTEKRVASTSIKASENSDFWE
jgi:hypothetical protein